MRRFTLFAILGVATLAAPVLGGERQIVRLAIEEEAGAARANEPVTMGVPFPEGAVKDASTLAMKGPDGKPVPCQFEEVSRWRTEKGGVRWVHATWLASVPAKGKAEFAVVDVGAPVAPPAMALKATEENGVVTVVTGFVKFRVRGAKFNGFDGAWFDPAGKGDFSDATRVVPPGATGGSRVSADGKTCLSLGDPEGKVEIERAGPLRVVVKATGTHKDEAGGRVFDYIVRFHAYANSPIVRVQHTFVNRQGSKPADKFLMTDLAFEVPTVLAKPKIAIGTEAAPWAGAAADAAAVGLQKSSEEFEVGLLKADAADAVFVEGGETRKAGKGSKPLSLGWIDLGSGGKNLACGVRWFWQMWPKAVVARPDGTLRVGLYPAEHGSDFEVYMGQARTHDLTFLFHKGLDAGTLNTFFSGTQRPLRAFASPKYYCRIAKAFGPSAESNAAIFGEDWPKVQKYDKKLAGGLANIIRKLDGHKYGAAFVDGYGFYPWGDSYHWYWGEQQKSPNNRPEWSLAWEGNYYDFPNATLIQFARTGDKKYLERFEPCARHVGDVFMCHYHPKKHLWGACRYCPPRNHVAHDKGNPYVSIEFNHAKSQCVFNHYYLYGDLRSLDNALLLANNALNNHAPDSGWAARGLGAHLAQIWCAYELTGEEKHLARLKDMTRRGLGQTKGGSYKKGGKFMWGIAYEGMVYSYWITKDPKTLDALKSAYDKRMRDSYMISNLALGAAFLYGETGEEAYKKYAWKAVLYGDKTVARPKSFGLAWRNTGLALYYLSKARAEEKLDAWMEGE